MATPRDLIAARLRWLLARRGWKPAEFARQMKKSRTWATDLANGDTLPTIDTLADIAARLEVPTFTFFLEVDEKNPRGYDLLRLAPDQESAASQKGGADVASQSVAPRLLALEDRIAAFETRLEAAVKLAAAAVRASAKRQQRGPKDPPPEPGDGRGTGRRPR